MNLSNPYKHQPAYTFWKNAVADVDEQAIDLITRVPFTLSRNDRVGTAGSCFAQHIARTLSAQGFNYLVTEQGPMTPGARDEGYGLFSARYGNVYTVRQLLQLFDRAYGLFEPADQVWRGRMGWVDPFRPRIQAEEFATPDEVSSDRQTHLAAVRRVFEDSDVFIFTLGLTEGWVSTIDGAVFPLAPGVGGRPDDSEVYAPQNFRVAEMVADLELFLAKLRAVNPGVRVILTVSPVPLIATFEDRHVALSTSYSKAALRVVAEEVSMNKDWVAYFPSYDLVTAHFTSGFFEADQRGIRDEGVQRVMAMFRRHFLSGGEPSSPAPKAVPPAEVTLSERDEQRLKEIDGIVCDEEAIVEDGV